MQIHLKNFFCEAKPFTSDCTPNLMRSSDPIQTYIRVHVLIKGAFSQSKQNVFGLREMINFVNECEKIRQI